MDDKISTKEIFNFVFTASQISDVHDDENDTL